MYTFLFTILASLNIIVTSFFFFLNTSSLKLKYKKNITSLVITVIVMFFKKFSIE